MNKIVLTLALLFMTTMVNAQISNTTSNTKLSQPMESFLKACQIANQGTSSKNADLTQKAIDIFTELNMASLSDRRIVSLDSTELLPLENHLIYDAEYLDSLIVYQFEDDVVQVNPTMFLRGDDMPDLCYTTKVIKPRGIANFKCKGSGMKEILIVSEYNTPIELKIDDDKNNVHITGLESYGVGTSYAIWEMPIFSTFIIQIRNKSDNPFSFVIAINQ